MTQISQSLCLPTHLRDTSRTLQTHGLTQAGVQEAIARFGNSPDAEAMDQAVDLREPVAADARKKLNDALGAVNTGNDSAAKQSATPGCGAAYGRAWRWRPRTADTLMRWRT